MKDKGLINKQLVVGPLLTNCYLIFQDNNISVVDPGGDLNKILKETQGKNISHIFLTHYHFDHIEEALNLKEKTGAKIFIHEKEKGFIDFEPDRFLKDGDKIRIGGVENSKNRQYINVIHTPGHTKGSICLQIGNIIFTGDTLFKDGFGRTDLSGGSEKDLKKSLVKLKKILKPGTKVCPGHGPCFKV